MNRKSHWNTRKPGKALQYEIEIVDLKQDIGMVVGKIVLCGFGYV